MKKRGEIKNLFKYAAQNKIATLQDAVGFEEQWFPLKNSAVRFCEECGEMSEELFYNLYDNSIIVCEMCCGEVVYDISEFQDEYDDYLYEKKFCNKTKK